MSVDLREQMREIGEVQRSTRMPVELHELGTVLQETPAASRRMNLRGPVVALGVAMIVLVVVGGIGLLFGSVEEAFPADSVTKTTLATATSIPSDAQEGEAIITRSSGPVDLSVAWTRPDDSALFSWGSPFSPAGPIAYIDGQYVFPLVGGGGEADPFPFAFSDDGSEWTVESLLPDSGIRSIPFNSQPLTRNLHGNLQVVEWGIEWPAADGSLPDSAHYAFHDGQQWHQRSYPIDFALEATGTEEGQYQQYWVCNSDGIGEIIRYGVLDGLGQGVSEGYLSMTNTGAVQVATPPSSQIACLSDGIFSVNGVDVYQLADTEWTRVAGLPVEPSGSGWMPANDQYMYSSPDGLHLTSDFASWTLHRLPEEVVDLTGGLVVIERDGLWMIVEGSAEWARMPDEGTWISEDLDTWEFLPSPDFSGVDFSDVRADQISVSLPVEGLFVAVHYESEPVAPIWIGRIGP